MDSSPMSIGLTERNPDAQASKDIRIGVALFCAEDETQSDRYCSVRKN
jgi:hypothetical protein